MPEAPSMPQVQQRVHDVADRIQPLLHPHPGLARRNAHAHVWLGIRERFGQDWRERACLTSVMAFVEWIEANPNAEYGVFDGPIRHRTTEERGLLFETG
jgi:hypothetical protein